MKTSMKIQNTSSNTPVDSNVNISISNINEAHQEIYEEDEESIDVDYDENDDMQGEWHIFGNMHNDDKAIYIKLCIPHSASDIGTHNLINYIETGVSSFRKELLAASAKQHRILVPSPKL